MEEPNNEKVISLERKVEELQEDLARISRDPKEAENYSMREYARNDRQNVLLSAEEKGERKARLEITKSLKGILLEEIISEKTGLSLEEIKSL